MRRGRGWSLLVLLVLLGAAPAAAAPEWTSPLPGLAVTRDFAPPADRYGAGHRGVDLAGAVGAPVLAAGAGRVSYAGLLAGRGVVVVVHGELRTTYEPVTASVRAGEVVTAGAPLGTLAAGHPGCAAPACLHWGLRRGEVYLDPLVLVGGGPVRLLPPDGSGRAQAAPEVPPAPLAAVEPGEGGRQSAGDEPVGAPVTDPSWSLRAAEAPLGAAAVVALVAGIGLLARPRPGPAGPASGGVAAPVGAATAADEPARPPGRVIPPPSPDEPARPPGRVLDLDRARAQRRAG